MGSGAEKEDKCRTCMTSDRLAAEMFLMERGGWQSHGVVTVRRDATASWLRIITFLTSALTT